MIGKRRRSFVFFYSLVVVTRAHGQLNFKPDNFRSLTEADPNGGGYICSVCKPDQILSKPDQRIEIPDRYGTPETTCSLLDKAMLSIPSLFTEESCQELRDHYGEDCGCVYPGVFTATTSTNEEPSSQEGCLICPPGQTMTTLDNAVAVPAGLFDRIKSKTSCEDMDSAIRSNPDFVNENMCTTLQRWYRLLCKCRDLNDPWFESPSESEMLLISSATSWQIPLVFLVSGMATAFSLLF